MRGEWGALAPACTPVPVQPGRTHCSGWVPLLNAADIVCVCVLLLGVARRVCCGSCLALPSPWGECGQRLRWSPVCCSSSSCHPLVSPTLCCGGNHKSVVGTQASSLCDGRLPTLSSGSTEDFQVVWYHPVPSRINAFFHLKALSKPKSWPSKARGAPKVHLSIPLVS